MHARHSFSLRLQLNTLPIALFSNEHFKIPDAIHKFQQDCSNQLCMYVHTRAQSDDGTNNKIQQILFGGTKIMNRQ